ncbi:diacylglycerol/lipid kinase family protein [Pseudofrankia sp. BMG5.37]|uniref:diacylglycerol/lipid kinase family protein n=1 Tax=Pseudofrankia sp. BMG5.37 TaxID=3050035 RepID=UPI0037C916A1
MVCFAGAVAVVLARLADRPIALPVSVVAVSVTAMAGWTALVGRGRRRVAASLVAAVAFSGLIAFAGVAGLTSMLVTTALLFASGGAARAAFGRHRPKGTIVGPAQRGVLLVNPRSGGGAADRHHLAQEAARRGVEVVSLAPGADLRALAEHAADGGADVVGMAGGDGSQGLVADVARRRGMAFVCVPAGTRNHFALDLGLDRNDVAGALDAFDTAVERRVDLGQVGDRVFVNNVSLGVYAEIVRSDSYRDAKASTAAAMLPDLLGPDCTPPDLRFAGSDGRAESSADVLLVSNNPYQLHSLGGLGTRPRLDSGRLGLVALRVDRARDLPTLVALESVGAISRFRGFQQWSSPVARVDSAQPVSVGVDGEALCLTPPLLFRSLPGAVRVRVPRHAPGVPVARPGTWGTVPALIRIAAGRPAAMSRRVRGGDEKTVRPVEPLTSLL